MLGSVVERVIIKQNSAQDGALGVNISRKAADGGFESRH
jgi:hypothetical protein